MNTHATENEAMSKEDVKKEWTVWSREVADIVYEWEAEETGSKSSCKA